MPEDICLRFYPGAPRCDNSDHVSELKVFTSGQCGSKEKARSTHRLAVTRSDTAENRRTTRSLNQALLAGELHDAIILCLKESKLMPTTVLLRSLIAPCVLGIWLLRYAKDEEVRDSVANLSTPEIVKNVLVGKDQNMFAFVFEEVKGTDHQFYRDVLHPSIHGDALHIAMRLRDEKSRRTWVHKVIFHTNHVYVHFMLQFAESGLVPAQMHEYFNNESLKSLQMMTTLLNHPDWKGTNECLSE